MLHPGFVRYYEDVILALAEGGSSVHLAFETARAKLGEDQTVRQLVARSERITYDVAPTRSESVRDFLSRGDRRATRSGGGLRSSAQRPRGVQAWESLATTVRLLADYLRFFEPAFEHTPALRHRAEKRLPRVYRGVLALVVRGGRVPRTMVAALLAGIERVIPPNEDVEAFVSRHRPDLLLVTPLIELGSQQVDYVKCARKLGIRSALCVASWDNLTSKGLIRVIPDHVIVWNETQKQEATTLHGVSPGQIIVTGAQLFDRWFSARPSRSREEFCRVTGLDPSNRFVLYVGSSVFIAPDEVPFVERWLRALRRAEDPAVASASVLIRPHPANSAQWRAFDTSSWKDVALWPAPGLDPARSDARRDYFDSLFYSAAVVGINTSAQIEAGIVGRPVFTTRAPEFRHAQAGTLHFQYLVRPGGGLVRSSDSLSEHVSQLSSSLADRSGSGESSLAFLRAFVRPHGLDQPAVPIFVREVQKLSRRKRPTAVAESAAVRFARVPVLLLAFTARTLAEDRPVWVYPLRPLVTGAVWTSSAVYGARHAWHERAHPRLKRVNRRLSRASYDARKRLVNRMRRVRKPIGALVRGAARRMGGRVPE